MNSFFFRLLHYHFQHLICPVIQLFIYSLRMSLFYCRNNISLLSFILADSVIFVFSNVCVYLKLTVSLLWDNKRLFLKEKQKCNSRIFFEPFDSLGLEISNIYREKREKKCEKRNKMLPWMVALLEKGFSARNGQRKKSCRRFCIVCYYYVLF